MAAITPSQSEAAKAIYNLYVDRRKSEHSRGYIGGSNVGHPCDRYLWMSFRWAKREEFDGRILRLFDTGHREEARLLDELKAIGCKVYDRDDTGKQFEFTAHGDHFQLHMDAVVVGLPEAPDTAHYVDVKTIKAAKLKDLIKRGIRNFEPKYYAQGNISAYFGAIEKVAYFFTCKDDDTIYVERWDTDVENAKASLARAERIITAGEPPPRIADKADAAECMYCPFSALCHGAEIPGANCRTCAHSTPEMSGGARWSCAHTGRDLTVESQRKGCPDHRYIPPMVSNAMSLISYREDSRAAWAVKGAGEVLQPPWQSSEIAGAVNAGTPEVLVDPFLNALKTPDPDTGECLDATLVLSETPFSDMKDDLPWFEPAAQKSKKTA